MPQDKDKRLSLMEKTDDYEPAFVATLKHWQEFEKSAVWKDIQTMMYGRIHNVRTMLETIDGENLIPRIANAQGEIAMARDVLEIVTAIKQSLLEKKEEERNDRR